MHCTYCGERATTIDHVPPQHARQALRDTGWRGKFVTVNACRECNCVILNGRALFTVDRRKRFVAAELTKRYRRILKSPDWTQGEIESLGQRGLLREYIEAFERAKRRLKRRITFASGSASTVTVSVERAPRHERGLRHRRTPYPGPPPAKQIVQLKAKAPQKPRPAGPRNCKNCDQPISLESPNRAYCDMLCARMHESRLYYCMTFEQAFRHTIGSFGECKPFIERVGPLVEARLATLARIPAVARRVIRRPSPAKAMLEAQRLAAMQVDMWGSS